MSELWIKDPEKWKSLPLTEQLEHLRKHYCTGPCGQSMKTTMLRAVTNRVLRAAIKELELPPKKAKIKWTKEDLKRIQQTLKEEDDARLAAYLEREEFEKKLKR